MGSNINGVKVQRSIIDRTRKWIGNATYIVYVTSLAVLHMVTACSKISYFLHKHQMKATKKLTGIYSGHTWVCVMVKLILL